MNKTGLPIEAVLPELRQKLGISSSVVLQAEPGAGKTTVVPLALLGEPWLSGKKIILLEPRRLAARAAAARMAETLGEPVGETVGYRIRMETRVGKKTRVEVVTEGILTRMIQSDPAIEGAGLLIFDEFHERSIHADLGLALALDVQQHLREDLKILVMSATLDTGGLSKFLGNAPVVSCEGRSFPVETRYLPKAGRGDEKIPVERQVCDVVLRTLREETGDILAFLPGGGEINRTAGLLKRAGLPDGVDLCPLYGDLPKEAQDKAIRPGRVRKVVLATAIAETSLTIDGVRVVVDGGLMRVPRFDPGRGMSRLDTIRASKASADQRRGRAGRTAPGVCYRLWRESEEAGFVFAANPEILDADLAPLALELALWGSDDPLSLCWLDPPPSGAYSHARELLTDLGALDAKGKVTPHGRIMASLPLHPRLAHMVLRGKEAGLGVLACRAAALLSERDILKGSEGGDPDLRLRLEALRGDPHSPNVDREACRRIELSADRIMKQLVIAGGEGSPDDLGRLVAFAYPDRVARRRPGAEGRYLLANGRGAFFRQLSPLAASEWLAVADLDGGAKESRIYSAAPLLEADIVENLSPLIRTEEALWWDERTSSVMARRRRRLGAIILNDDPLSRPDPSAVAAALMEGVRRMGLAVLPWDGGAANLRARVMFLRRVDEAAWPDLSDEALLNTLEEWLAPFASGMTRRDDLKRIDLKGALLSLLSRERQRELNRLAPSEITVPTGSSRAIDYSEGRPVLAVRLQEMFGLSETPSVAGGRVPITLHLLSPAGRPIQVTSDLTGFWLGSYEAVRKEMRGRYPKHDWPDDPLSATPTNRAKARKK